MAKQLKLFMNGASWEAGIAKLDRDKLYGYVEEVVTDTAGNPCTAGSLMDDGRTLILQGEIALKTLGADGNEVSKGSLRALWPDGTEAVKQPSSWDTGVTLEEAAMDDLFNLEVASVYQLAWQDSAAKSEMLGLLKGEKVLRCVFRYTASYEGSDALLIAAQNEIFLLSGQMTEFEYLENKVVLLDDDPDEESGAEEEIDFGML